MFRKTGSAIMLFLLSVSTLTLAVTIQPAQSDFVWSGTIYIRADGSIDPDTAPISTADNVTYTLTGNVTSDADGIVVERDNIVVDGAGYTLNGSSLSGFPDGINLSGRSNVTVKNATLTDFHCGIYLYSSSNNTISGNNITANNGYGIWLRGSSNNNTISGNNITDNHAGIYLSYSSNNMLRSNTMDNNERNFGVYGDARSYFLNDADASNTVDGKPVYYWINKQDMVVPLDAGYVALVNCTRITVKNLNIINNREGILLVSTTNSTIIKNNMASNDCGIRLEWSFNNTISGNNVTANDWYGIDLDYSVNNTISGNNITANAAMHGSIYFYKCSNNSISGNNITNNMGGIQLHDSSNNVVSENNITNNLDGIILDSSSNNNISGNTFTNDGLHVYDSYQNSVVDNTVNGKPLVYLEGVVEYTVGDAGQVVLVNSDSIRVENLNLSRTSIGVQLWETTNSIIDGNNIVNNGYGIWLDSSSNNSINGNNITANNWGGIQLHDSSNNVVSENNITNNRDGIVLSSSSSNSISGNNVTANNDDGIALGSSSSNSISGNNIANNEYGVALYESSYNSISMNKITTNERGIHIQESSSNMVSGNNITANSEAGTWLHRSSDNSIYHNNFIDNSQQVYDYAWDSPHVSPSTNLWDDSYTGNFWSDYEERYPNATEIDDSGIWNTPYVIDANNRDRHPLMGPCTPPEHELLVSINAPTSLWLGSSSSLDAIVTNEGLNDEVDVELLLLINGTLADSRTILLLQAGDSYRLSYLWTPTNEETYNVTAYARPVLGEVSVENNQKTKFVTVAEVEVGVKAGDWIKCTYTISGWPGGQPYPEWLRVEFLTVEGTNATVYVTMRMSDGTEQSDTMTVDVAVGGGTFQGLSGFVIPANCTTGDSIYITGHGNLAIAGESTRIYAGASRTVVYANFSFQGNQLTYYWDKHTGVMVESSAIYPQLNITATAKATETNMWQAKPLLVGDLDNDGKVGIQDLAVAAKVFGSYPGHPRWNPIADINKDNTTNIVDLVLIAKNFGKNQQN